MAVGFGSGTLRGVTQRVDVYPDRIRVVNFIGSRELSRVIRGLAIPDRALCMPVVELTGGGELGMSALMFGLARIPKQYAEWTVEELRRWLHSPSNDDV